VSSGENTCAVSRKERGSGVSKMCTSWGKFGRVTAQERKKKKSVCNSLGGIGGEGEKLFYVTKRGERELNSAWGKV